MSSTGKSVKDKRLLTRTFPEVLDTYNLITMVLPTLQILKRYKTGSTGKDS